MNINQVAEKINDSIGDDVANIAGKLAIAMLQQQGKLIHPKDIYNIAMTTISELVVSERLIIKTRRES